MKCQTNYFSGNTIFFLFSLLFKNFWRDFWRNNWQSIFDVHSRKTLLMASDRISPNMICFLLGGLCKWNESAKALNGKGNKTIGNSKGYSKGCRLKSSSFLKIWKHWYLLKTMSFLQISKIHVSFYLWNQFLGVKFFQFFVNSLLTLSGMMLESKKNAHF